MFQRKRKLGIKKEYPKGVVETIKLYFIDHGLKYSCVCDVFIPSKYDKKISNLLMDRERLLIENVEMEYGKKHRALSLGMDSLVLICLSSKFEPKVKFTHVTTFTLGGYGREDQSYEKIKGEVILIEKGGLETKLKEDFIPVRSLELLNKKEKYPAGILFKNYIFEAEIK